MRISDAAAASGCHLETIRYYERVGLLPSPERTASGYRAYTPSDIDRLRARGVQVRVDDAPSHMHHKFALFDGRVLANGSFNWTRSATRDNDENLVVSDDANLVRVFGLQFGKLWQQFG